MWREVTGTKTSGFIGWSEVSAVHTNYLNYTLKSFFIPRKFYFKDKFLIFLNSSNTVNPGYHILGQASWGAAPIILFNQGSTILTPPPHK